MYWWRTPCFEIARRHVLPLLNREEWEYWWYEDHLLFIKRQALMGRRTHHLHFRERLKKGMRLARIFCRRCAH